MVTNVRWNEKTGLMFKQDQVGSVAQTSRSSETKLEVASEEPRLEPEPKPQPEPEPEPEPEPKPDLQIASESPQPPANKQQAEVTVPISVKISVGEAESTAEPQLQAPAGMSELVASLCSREDLGKPSAEVVQWALSAPSVGSKRDPRRQQAEAVKLLRQMHTDALRES